MTTKLEQIYETKNGNLLIVSCHYDASCNMIESVEVISVNKSRKVNTDLTDIFETVPQLADLIDDIDWREIANQEKEEEVYDEA